MTSSSVFESFNAKNLNPEQVARSFVPSDNFMNLARRRHSLIIGPRGSGKTTLLKMLQSEALDLWDHREADKFRSLIDFNGVFIPTDRVWKEQVDSLSQQGLNKDEGELFATSIFTTHVLYQLSLSFQYKSTSFHSSTITVFIEHIATLWKLKLRSFSFTSLISALAIRKNEVPMFVNQLKRLSLEERRKALSNPNQSFINLDVIQAINSSVDIFAVIFDDKRSNWALLFDELELAPKCVVQKLLDSLRGSNDRVIFKLSMAPYSPDTSTVKDISSAMPGNDYDFILLWHSKKKSSDHEFSEALFNSMLKERGLSHLSANDILALPTLKLRDTIISEAYDNDPSFREYLNSKNIPIKEINEITGAERHKIIGKISPLLRVRNSARKPMTSDNLTASYTTLKSFPDYYSGPKALFEILEGNPRWIIGVLTPLLDEFEKTQKKVSTSRQLQEVKITMNKFLLLLRTIPSPISNSKSPQGVDFALNIIGEYFRENSILSDFQDRPKGSFVVDKSIDITIQASLGAALNAGALVHVNADSKEVFLGELTNHRFRISYLLAPKYQLPLNLMDSIRLSRILDQNEGVYELSLFD